MRNPLPLLATSLVLAGAAGAADAPPLQLASSHGESQTQSKLPTWTTQEEPWISWRPVDFRDDAGKTHELWCRTSECDRGKTQGRTKLYVFATHDSKPYICRNPECRGLSHPFGSPSMKATHTTLLSKFELAMEFKPHRAVLPGTDKSFAVVDLPQLAPMPGYVLIVQAPTAVADDAPKKAKKSSTGKKSAAGNKDAKKSKPAQEKDKKAVAALNAPLTETEVKWLTFGEQDEYEKALASAKDDKSALRKATAAARALIVENVLDKETEKGGYAKKVAVSAAAVEAYLKPLGFYAGDDVALNFKQYPLTEDLQKQYKVDIEAEGMVGGQLDHVAAHRVVVRYRLLAGKGKPGGNEAAGTGEPAALDLTPLTDEERKWLTDDERAAYDAKLAGAKGRKDKDGKPAVSPKEISGIISTYRERAKENKATTPTNEKEFNALTDPQKNKFCKDLIKAEGGSSGQVITGAKDQAEAAAQSTESAEGILTGKAKKEAGVAAGPPPAQGPQTEADKLKKLCKDFLAALPGAEKGSFASRSVPTPGKMDCDKKDKDGKCVGEEEKEDANEWLAVKRGVAIGAMGAFFATAFGPVGIVIGAVVGFALAWGLTKLEK